MTGVRLQLFSEPEMHLFVKNSICGGVPVISHRHAVANNRYTGEDGNETEQNSFIFLLDANNLYGHSMVGALSNGDIADNLECLLTAPNYPIFCILHSHS